jgi:hypothetical protein
MEQMIDEINEQRFFPDSSRSGYFPKGIDMPEDSKDVESTSSSGDSRDEEEADHSGDEAAAAVDRFAGAWGSTETNDKVEYFRHKTSRCLHYTADETGQLFSCGRMVTLQYNKCSSVPAFLHPSCAGCFRR